LTGAIFLDPYAVDVAGYQKRHNCDYAGAWDDGCVLASVKRNQGRGATKSGREHAKLIAETPVTRADYSFASTRRRRDQLDPRPQAEVFCLEVGELGPADSVPWLDLEWHTFGDDEAGQAEKEAYYENFTRADQTEWALEWLDYVEQRLGVRPGIYTLASFAKSRLKPSDELRRSLLWLANAGRDPAESIALDPDVIPTPDEIDAGWIRGKYGRRSPVPSHWDEWILYQWTSRGNPDWYGGKRIDRNVLRYGLATLESLQCGQQNRSA
jgi:hypothetical protein